MGFIAREAYKIWVDIDSLEMSKPTVKADMPIHADLAEFLPVLENELYEENLEHASWLKWCKERSKIPHSSSRVLGKRKNKSVLFYESLFEELEEGQNIITGNGSACVVGFQTQRN